MHQNKFLGFFLNFRSYWTIKMIHSPKPSFLDTDSHQYFLSSGKNLRELCRVSKAKIFRRTSIRSFPLESYLRQYMWISSIPRYLAWWRRIFWGLKRQKPVSFIHSCQSQRVLLECKVYGRWTCPALNHLFWCPFWTVFLESAQIF